LVKIREFFIHKIKLEFSIYAWVYHKCYFYIRYQLTAMPDSIHEKALIAQKLQKKITHYTQ